MSASNLKINIWFFSKRILTGLAIRSISVVIWNVSSRGNSWPQRMRNRHMWNHLWVILSRFLSFSTKPIMVAFRNPKMRKQTTLCDLLCSNRSQNDPEYGKIDMCRFVSALVLYGIALLCQVWNMFDSPSLWYKSTWSNDVIVLM